jgi:hypothetical protein
VRGGRYGRHGRYGLSLFGLTLAALSPQPAASLPPQIVPEPLPPPSASLQESFTALTSVVELGDGRVLLTDPREARIVVADLALQSVEAVGRRGQGPGEYMLAAPIRPLQSGRSVMIDGLGGRWLTFEGPRIVRTRTGSDPAGAALAGSFP